MPWTFTTSNSTNFDGNRTEQGRYGPGWSYHGKYELKTQEDGVHFVSKVSDVMRSEGIALSVFNSEYFSLHLSSFKGRLEPSSSSTSPDPSQSSEETTRQTTVFIRIKTSNAYIPEEILKLRPQVPAREAVSFPTTLIVPGLTIRDIRFAMLVDHIFKNEYLEAGHGIDSMSIRPLPLPYPSAELMAANIFRQGFCPCCGLPHRIHDCIQRKQFPPRGECKVCGEKHWVVDCPIVKGPANPNAKGARDFKKQTFSTKLTQQWRRKERQLNQAEEEDLANFALELADVNLKQQQKVHNKKHV
ncbi:hypothetical protein BDP27DRAFT_813243 [Rhodocollybia butyracea]|uniref:Uncharacterized protein n=1 Tax=Rhodocollybia butyracea TaxID=206335 RepID=A0A9P5Q8I4_9AGAR|nr:hypothetical protein BDP27DRAFT_813243 [Rhodocollybia butyracea]